MLYLTKINNVNFVYTRNIYLSTKYLKYISTDLAPIYVAKNVEEMQPSAYFEPEIKPSKYFSMILPPPNVTGSLHIGHALTATIEDVIVRWHRMQGSETLWIPGSDHAGIAAQVVVEKKIWQEHRLLRHQLGRDNFEKEVWKWKNDKSDIIKKQLKSLGTCLDWSKEYFTMDERQCSIVKNAFVRLFDKGLIYRADRIVSWSCALRSAISDIEVEHLEVKGRTVLNVNESGNPVEFGVLTKFAYKLTDSDEELVVATTRPETIFGDVAVAVHPQDMRYSRFIGKKLIHPFVNRELIIISDESVDPQFGTGIVKVTPAHDPVDFEIRNRHNLPLISVIDEVGKLNSKCGKFSGLFRFEGRQAVVEELKKIGAFRGNEELDTVVPVCSRSGDVIEFLVKEQWFVKCDKMAETVKKSNLDIYPENYKSDLLRFMDNIRDWCISRQLWWGHRVPAYRCHPVNDPEKQVWIAAESHSTALAKAIQLYKTSEVVIKQDEDVLDTWFSSALLPFSTLQERQKEFEKFYPLSLMETGHDILFFWVARMVMLGAELTGKMPFRSVLLHGVICDATGKKMSKSKDNVIAPEQIIKESGVDALRITLCSHNVKNRFINFDANECKLNVHFCNKIWQATKFTKTWILEALKNQNSTSLLLTNYTLMDKWALSRLNLMIETVDKSLRNYDFHIAVSSIKNFLYYDFCDIYLESTKRGLKKDSRLSHCDVLARCLDVGLRVLAPFMPHVSQLLHKHLPLEMINIKREYNFPEQMALRDVQLEEDVTVVMNAVVAIRRLKKLFALDRKTQVRIITDSPLFLRYDDFIKDLSNSNDLIFLSNSIIVNNNNNNDDDDDDDDDRNDYVSDSIGNLATVQLLFPEDKRKNLQFDENKLKRKSEKIKKELDKLEKMTTAETYKTNAPVKVQQTHQQKISSLMDDLARVHYLQKMVNR